VNAAAAAHYRAAEQELEMAGDYDLGFVAEQWYLGAATVHALLALAAVLQPVPESEVSGE
jgi:hypothetical protein